MSLGDEDARNRGEKTTPKERKHHSAGNGHFAMVSLQIHSMTHLTPGSLSASGAIYSRGILGSPAMGARPFRQV